MRMLVAIASYGNKNDAYLSHLIGEYRSMSFDVDIVVLSNVPKQLGPGVEVVVGLPDKDPWSLPFPHKQIFADRQNDYDLFLYSEDDMLVTERNIGAFLRLTEVLPDNEIAGFLRFENAPNGRRNYPEIHGCFHWDPASVRKRGGHTLAFFTNEHSACYLLTRAQLQRAIQSGGFLVGPHKGKYDLLCSAATDPYTQCGFQRLISISEIDDFLIHHLPNKYVGTSFGIDDAEFRRQIGELLHIGGNGHRPASLFNTETRLPAVSYSKDYYEPVRTELAELIPAEARSVLSVGCGWGAIEAWLVQRGLQVTALPLDAVIAGKAQTAGVELIQGDFGTARRGLAGRKFDCVLLMNVLHLVPEPAQLLRDLTSLGRADGRFVVLSPNMSRLPNRARALYHRQRSVMGDYPTTGAHYSSPRTLRGWFEQAGMVVEKRINCLTAEARKASRWSGGLADSLLSSEFFVVARGR